MKIRVLKTIRDRVCVIFVSFVSSFEMMKVVEHQPNGMCVLDDCDSDMGTKLSVLY